jgi:uncharacterized membrane protein
VQNGFCVKFMRVYNAVAGIIPYTYYILFNMDQQQQSSQPSGNASAPSGQEMKKPEKNTLMGILAYIGILIIIPFLVAKDDPFVKFHIKQGLVLVIIEIVVWFVGMSLWQLWELFQLINLACIIFSIIGIVNVAQGNEKELPFIGSLGKSFNF